MRKFEQLHPGGFAISYAGKISQFFTLLLLTTLTLIPNKELKAADYVTCTNGLISNWSFETSTDGWTFPNGTNIERKTDWSACGSYGVSIDNGNGIGQLMSNTSPAIAGKTYNVFFWSGTDDTSYDHIGYIEFLDGSGTVVGSESVGIEHDINGGGLAWYAITATAPANTTGVRFKATCSGNYLKIDCVCLTEVPDCDPTIPETCNAEHSCDIVDNDITGRSFWTDAYGVFAFVNGGKLEYCTGGVAYLTGEIAHVANPSDSWKVYIKLVDMLSYNELIAAGGSPVNPGYGDATTWMYYVISNESRLFGTNSNCGKVVNVSHRPSDLTKRVQIGDGANLQDAGLGISSWFSFSGDWVCNGDINADISGCTVVCDMVIVAPEDYETDCDSSIDPSITGYPSLDINCGTCDSPTYVDSIFSEVDCVIITERTWTVTCDISELLPETTIGYWDFDECDASGPTDCCDDGKPVIITMLFQGNDCSASSNDQGNYDSCSGSTSGISSAYLIASKRSDGAEAYFTGTVAVGSEFSIDASAIGATEIKSNTYIFAYTNQGGSLLQEIVFHTSCSVPLKGGDIYGGFKIQSMLMTNGSTCSGREEYASYQEFNGTGYGTTCSTTSVSNVRRSNPSVNHHSCVDGYNGSTAGMCVTAENGSTASFNDQLLEFDVTITPSNDFEFSSIQFYLKAPTEIIWQNNSNQGPNNYPQKYAIRVLKGSSIVFEQIDITTTREWSLQSIDLSNETDFVINSEEVFTVQITAYDPIGNSGIESLWDIDELYIKGKCVGSSSILTATDTQIITQLCDKDEITGIVWIDQNGNGCQDIDEPVVNDITIALYECDDDGAGGFSNGTGNLVDQTTTVNGVYSFIDCYDPNKQYYLQIQNIPAGFKLTDPFSDDCTDDQDSDANIDDGKTGCMSADGGIDDKDFGIYAPASVGDKVFADTDGDGIQDAGEAGIDGIEVKLKDENGDVIATKVTANGGLYLFDGLSPGTYSVMFVLGAGQEYSPLNAGTDDAVDSDADPAMDGMTATFVLESGDEKDDVDAGIYEPASVGDKVFADTDGDGIQDAGEAGIDGIEVKLKDENGDVIATKVTANGGLYLFDGLAPGTYSVMFVLGAGQEYSPLNAGTDDAVDSDADPAMDGMTATFVLESGDEKDDVDAGIYEPASVGDKVFADTDGDGIQDAGEAGIDGIEVKLKDENGDVIATKVTANGGLYLFDGLAPGTYSVMFVLGAGQEYSPLNAGTDDAVDSDADPAMDGMTATFVLESGDEKDDVDAGIYEPASVGDKVFADTDGDGIQDAGEAGIDGIEVKLKDENGDVIATKVTANGGLYLFDGLAPGTYSVMFVLGAGQEYSPLNAGTDDAVDSDADPAMDGMTATFVLESGDEKDDVDAGIFMRGEVCIYTFKDCDNNGDLRGDIPLPNVPYDYLYTDANGAQINGHGLTDDKGVDCIDLRPGSIDIKIFFPTSPTGLSFTDANIVDDAFDSDADANGVIPTIVITSGSSTEVAAGFKDIEKPTLINVSSDATYECDAVVYPMTPTATDNCDKNVMVTRDSTITPGECPQEFTIEYVWTATDECGNVKKDWTTIKVVDTTDPELVNVPSDATYECDAVVYPGTPSATDNCDNDVTVTRDSTITMGDCPQEMTIEYVWTATDDCKNETKAWTTIKVVDTTDPELVNVPSDATYECDAVVYPGTPSATDNCDNDVTVTRDSTITTGDCPQEMTIEYVWTATDECGNMKKDWTTIKVVDTTDPELVNVPSDATYECDAVVYPGTPSATDNCDNDVTVSRDSTITMGDCPQEMTIEYVWTATDDCKNETKAWTTIKVVDTTDPELVNVPSDATYECDAVVYPSTPSATDNCDNDVTVTRDSTITTGDCPQEMTIEYVWTATDECGNMKKDWTTIKVVDTTDPELVNVPSDATYECDAVVYPGTPSATDNCDNDVTVTRDSTITMGDCPQEMTIEYVWTATDDCGNEAKAWTTVKVVDTKAPVAMNQPEDITVECGDPVPPYDPAWKDNCSDDLEISAISSTSYDGCTEIQTMKYTAKDECGNEASVSRKVTIVDTKKPEIINVPSDYEVACDAVVYPETPKANDICDGYVEVTRDSTITAGDCPQEYTIEYVWTAKDKCGNEAKAWTTVKVVDTKAPVAMNQPEDITVECGDPVPPYDPAWKDNCSDDLEISAISSTSYDGCTEIQTMKYTAKDECGNEASVSRKVTIVDTKKPEIINVPSDYEVACDAVVYPETPKANDICDGYVEVTRDSTITAGDCPQEYTIEYVWTAKDKCGNEAKAWTTVKVVDTKAPVAMNQPEDITVECGDPVPPYDPAWKDNCSDDLEISAISSTSYDGCTEIQTMKYTAKDECGNEASVSRKVTIVDTKKPEIINVPSDYEVACDAVVYPETPKANDICDGYVEVTRDSTITAGDCPQEYTIEYVWTAKDKCGNEAKAWTTVKVVDTKAPVAMNQPEDITVECGDPVPPYDPAWKDNCSDDLEISAISSTSYDGCTEIQTMKYTAKDECGNEASVSRKVTIVDTKKPEIINVPSDYEVACDAVVYPETPKANDICDGYVEVTRDSTITAGDCPQEYTIEYVWTAKDKCGNEKKAGTTIKVQDTKGPVAMNPPTDAVLYCGENIPPYDPMWKDNCSVNLEITVISSTGSTNCGEEQEYVYTATDECGNTSEVRRKVKIVDNEDPFFDGLVPDKRISCDEPIQFGTPAFADNCSIPTLTYKDDRKPGSCPNEYVVTRTWTITDLCGNTATTSANITVWDNDAPELLNVPRDASFECDKVVYPITPNAIDNCTGYVEVSRDSVIVYSEECPQNLTITYTWTASDECANKTIDQTVIKIMDTTAPVIGDIPQDLLVQLAKGEQIPEIPNVDVTDNCDSTVEVEVDEQKVPADCGYILKRTWTSVDACGNEAESKTQEIKVIDGIEASIIPAIVELCEGYSEDFTAIPTGDSYLYEWTVNGGGLLTNANASTVTFTGDTGGTYTISVRVSSKDAQECYGEATASIKVGRLPRASISNNGPICIDGTIMLGATGGATYEWSGPDGFSSMEQNPTIENASGDNAGTYTVVITEEECSTTLTTEVELYQNPEIIIENNSPVCEGATVVLKASGGTDYMWMDSDDNIVATGSTFTIENAQSSDAGIYTVMVANNNKCTAEKETEVVLTDKPEDITTKVEICEGETYVWEADGKTYTEEGTYHFEAEGCIADQYLKITFKPGGEDVVTNESICIGESYTWTVNGETYTEPGEYIVEGQGCYGNQRLILTVKPKAEDKITYAGICEGGSYTWEVNGQTYDAEGTYEVLGEGCEADQYLRLTLNPPVYAEVVYTSNSGCDNNDGVIKLAPASNTYAWSDGESGAERTDLSAGEYVITATNDEGCTKVFDFAIGMDCECILPKIEKIETTDITCGNDGGTATITTTTDPSQFGYTWLPNEGTPTNDIGNSRTGLPAGKYDVIVTYPGAKDCFAKATITIKEDGNAVTVTADVTNGDCETPGSIVLNVSGGDGNYTYDWAHIDGTDNPKDLSDLESGNYSVVVSDGAGCSHELENIAVFRDCDPCDMLEDVRVETKDETCNEKGSARFTPSTYYFTWLHDNVQAAYRTGLNAGKYIVIAEDPQTGCKTELEVVIDLVEPKDATINIDEEILLTCENQNGATIDFTVDYEEGFALPWQIIIANENGQNIPNGSLVAGDYCLYVKDANRCTITKKCITLIAPELVDVSYEVIDAECGLGGAIDLTIGSGTGPFVYTWSDGNTNEDRINVDAGSYDVTIVDGNLCETVIAEIVVATNCDPCVDGTGPEVEETKMDAGCENDGYIKLIVPSDADNTYNWSDLEGIDDPKDRNGLAPGTYIVTVTDNKGCSSVRTITISTNCDGGPTDCDIFDQDELSVTTTECDGGAKICLGVQLQDFKDLHLQINGQDYDGGITACNYAVTYSYQFKFLLDATPNGPYELEWSYDDVAFHQDSLNDISELAEFIIENDPTGNWSYNAEEAFLIGGNTDYDYSALRIFHYETAARYELNINTIYVPSNVEVTLPVGEHEIVIIDNSEDCTDTVKVIVVCESAANIIRTITVGDQTMVCLSDIVKGDGTSFENTCPSDLDYALASYNTADDCITFSGNKVGSKQFCYENCDADGNCKTTTITINVTPVNHRMVFITLVPGEDSTYCFDVSDFELNGSIDQVYLGCEDDNNETVDFKLNETNDCLEIEAVALGEDDACLNVCDDTNACDSLSIIVTVVDPTGGSGPLPNAVDNDTLTTRNKDITVRAIDNDQVNGTLINTGLVTEPVNGTVTVLPGGIFIYTPDNGFCGEEDQFTYFIENENGADTATVNIMVMCEEVIVFSGFSPNKDGINDRFEIIGIENYPENTVCIFNRWGNQVFLKRGYTNTDAWEGDWNEGDLPDGTYFYVIDLGDGGDKKSGYVQILR